MASVHGSASKQIKIRYMMECVIVIAFLIILSTFESYDMEEKMSFEERVRDIIFLNQLQKMIEVNEDSEESLFNIKKLKCLTEQKGLLRNFFLARDKNVHSLHHDVPTFLLVPSTAK